MSERVEFEPKMEPSTLDVVQIDGRWGQVRAVGGNEDILVTFLDNGSSEPVNLADFNLETYLNTSLENLFKISQIEIPERERGNLYYDAIHKNDPEFIQEIKVFGVYVKK